MSHIIIDALGSDAGPEMVADALLIAMKKREFQATLVGPEPLFQNRFSGNANVSIIPTEEFIHNEEQPVFALRRKKTSSTVLGLKKLNEEGDVFLTAGSTGALLAGGYFITKRMKGMDRLCLVPIIPRPGRDLLLADAGATMDTTPEVLLQFARITVAYAESAMGRPHPTVGLLNVGAESEKGDKRTTAAFELLKESELSFVGNIEARDIFFSDCDILLTDGFAGNVALKSIEGTAKFLMSQLKDVFMQSVKTKLGALLIKDDLKRAFSSFDYKNHGGAPLLGARKPLYKAHGNSTAETFALAIEEALDFAEKGQLFPDQNSGKEIQ